MDLAALKPWVDAGTTVIYLAGIIALWRQNTLLQAKYEGLLREAIATLAIVAKELDEDNRERR